MASIMEYTDNKQRALPWIGDRSSSDVVVRLRTEDGRDDWIYCHSNILIEKSTFFAERLSDNWPTCQIIDSRNCVEIYCRESDFDYHVNVLRLLYHVKDIFIADTWHNVKTVLGILRVAVDLGCQLIITPCVDYLEAVPWEEAEEEEMLKIIPSLGSQASPILARLQPVNPHSIARIFIYIVRFATSSPSPFMNDLRSSAQEQLEYMLTEDDDIPLLVADDEIKSEVRDCFKRLFAKFDDLLGSSVSGVSKAELFQTHLSDLSWACQILGKFESMREFVTSWIDASERVVNAVKSEMLEIKLKVIEVTAKVIEAVGYGTVILSTVKRIHVVRVWLPFVRATKTEIHSGTMNGADASTIKSDGELGQSLEAAFVSLILTLPSENQAEILSEWLGSEHIGYPDLTEVFEVWCYRAKVAKRRLHFLSTKHG